MASMGYPIDVNDKGMLKGICQGLSQMWQQAYLGGGEQEEYRFLARIDRINSEYNSSIISKQNIKQKMAEMQDKVKNHEELDEHDLFLQEVHAMFDGIMVYQSASQSKVGQGLFSGKLPKNYDGDIISTVAASDALEVKGGLLKLHKQPVVCSSDELQTFFDKLRDLIKEDAEDLTMNLGSGMHRIGVRYNAKTDHWTIINPGIDLDNALAYKKDMDNNKISLQEAINNNLTCSHENIAMNIRGSLSFQENCVFNLVINTTGNVNVENLTKKLAVFKSDNLNSLTKEHSKLDNLGFSLLNLAIMDNHLDFIKKCATEFKDEFRANIRLLTSTNKQPFSVAVEDERSEIVALMIENGALKMNDIEGNNGNCEIFEAIDSKFWDYLVKVLCSVTNENQMNNKDFKDLQNPVVQKELKTSFIESIKESTFNTEIPVEKIINFANILNIKPDDWFMHELLILLPKNHPFQIINPLRQEIENLKTSDNVFTPSSWPKVNVLEQLVGLIANPKSNKGQFPKTYGEIIKSWQTQQFPVGLNANEKTNPMNILQKERGFFNIDFFSTSPSNFIISQLDATFGKTLLTVQNKEPEDRLANQLRTQEFRNQMHEVRKENEDNNQKSISNKF